MNDDLDLPLYAHPSMLVGLAAARWGQRGLMERCVRLYREMDWGDEPELMSFVAGAAGPRWVELGFGTQSYFVRTWALRAMLYAWDDSASATVIDALEDEHWRPREMALKVVAKRRVDGDIDAVARLQDDPVPRVQAAARRALDRLSGDVRKGSAAHPPTPT
ncbi:MAG TPA: HEAT repeat domain-containing protein [Streptosporangiaceae bacterium]|nr:HEAT repeat domain-containing protein [Streptosporangiaceae bacterium]